VKQRKRRWFHCTQDDRGQQWVAARIVPPLAGAGEPRTPRLCVAPTVAGCLAARLWYRNMGPVVVYQTDPRSAIRPGFNRVWDAPLTGERWLVPPVTLHRVCEIPAKAVVDAMAWRPRLSGVLIHERAEWVVRMHEVVRVHAPQLACDAEAERAKRAVTMVNRALPAPGPSFDEDEMWECETSTYG
jgi:hypothetical protein